VDTILVFENGVSQVDLPCSGVKSLWTGMLFLLAATWIERRPMNLRWLATASFFVLLLLAANLIRVALLVAAGPVAGLHILAKMLHIPLGVVGFVAACAAVVYLLRRQPAKNALEEVTVTQPDNSFHPRPLWLGPVVAFSLFSMAVLYTPRPLPSPDLVRLPHWTFPEELNIEPLPLTIEEIQWITSGGAEAVERVRFHWKGLQGSMILITSQTWRAQHRPERCFEVYGLSVEQSETQYMPAALTVRSFCYLTPVDQRNIQLHTGFNRRHASPMIMPPGSGLIFHPSANAGY
jgi:exosortase O